MKKIVVLFVSLCLLALKDYGQLQDKALLNSHKINGEALFQKAKTQNAFGWVFIGGGVLIAYIGLKAQSEAGQENTNLRNSIVNIITNSNYPTNQKVSQTGFTIASIGAVTMLTSIPFFIASGKTRRKAVLELQRDELSGNLSKNSAQVLALNLKINF